jgi:predicted GNAT family acetyltransferase
MSAKPLPIRHDAAAMRFEAVVDGRTSFLTYSEARAGELDFQHTFVPAELRGRGIASRIVEHALGYARARGLKVLPTCSFVAAFMRRHPGWQDLAVESRRADVGGSVDKSVEKG